MRAESGDGPHLRASANEPTRSVRVWLALVIVIGVALRVAYLHYALGTPGYTWADPDGYIRQAHRLTTGSGWHWTFDVARYEFAGRTFALPPLYPVFLSLFVRGPGFPLTALVAQVLLSCAAMVAVFDLGRLVHSARAGLLAAAAYAIWVPAIFGGVWSTSQETVYLPVLLLAFDVLLRARRDRRIVSFAAAGLTFACAALTRSMPTFFVVPAALLHVVLVPTRVRAVRHALAFLVGFAALSVPYSLGLSRTLGQFTFIDSHGSIHLVGDQAEPDRAQPPGVLETARALAGSIAASPATYFADTASRARTLLYVNGGRLLQIYGAAGSKGAAWAWKMAVHAGTDLLLIAGLVLAPVGVILCRDRESALVLVLWVVVNVAVASLGGFGGARLRMPFEPMLYVLAAVVLAGRWRRRSVRAVLGAVLVSFALGAVVVPQLSRSLDGRPSYGVAWAAPLDHTRGTVNGPAGFNVPERHGRVSFGLGNARSVHNSDSRPLALHLRVGGAAVQTVSLTGGESRRFQYPWHAPGMVFVEVLPRPGTVPVHLSVTVGE
jgi:Dolichyl-phosphate-mannose-protein mannosyltransferase